ncbi:DNA replication regulator DPB11 [Pseudohyphozyma bogoriensis]|nr:DNA replication regulator DPB11 [Pseudohyphozyma bogoriensis]
MAPAASTRDRPSSRAAGSRPAPPPLTSHRISITGFKQTRTQLTQLGLKLGATVDALRRDSVVLIAEGWDGAIKDRRGVKKEDKMQVISSHLLPSFFDLNLTLTGFPSSSKLSLITLLTTHGATITPMLKATTSALVLSSTLSSAQALNNEKVINAKRGRIVVVWEGWVERVVKDGGVTREGLDKWEWKEGAECPSEEGEEELWEEGRERKKIKLERKKSLGWKSEGWSEGSSQAEVPGVEMVERKPAVKVDREELEMDERAPLQAPPSDDPSPATAPATATAPAPAPAPATAPAPARIPKPSPLPSSSSQPEFYPDLSTYPVLPPTSDVPHYSSPPACVPSSPFHADGAAEAGECDDSAFFDSIPDPSPAKSSNPSEEEEEESDGEVVKFFEGRKFVIDFSVEDDGEVVGEAVRERGGVLLRKEEAEVAEWILVDIFGAKEKYLDSSDPRVVTPIWVEKCLFVNDFVQPQDAFLEKPLDFLVPVAGAEKLVTHTTGLSVVDEAHFARFLRLIRAPPSTKALTSLTTTHLVTPDDLSKANEGPKHGFARKHGIPVVGRKAFVEVVRALAKASVLNGVTLCWGKGTAAKGDAADKLRAMGAKIATEFDKEVTHLVYEGSTRPREVKNGGATGVSVVHPAWVEECINKSKRVSEEEYPHTYDVRKGGQLRGLVRSPSKREASIVFGGSQAGQRVRRKSSDERMAIGEEERKVSRQPVSPLGPRVSTSTSPRPAAPTASPLSTALKKPAPAPLQSHPSISKQELKAQTSFLLAQFDTEAAPPPGSGRKSRVGSGGGGAKLSRTKSSTISPSHSFVDAVAAVPEVSFADRRVPGVGYNDETQSDDVEETYRVLFRDPTGANAIRALLGEEYVDGARR